MSQLPRRISLVEQVAEILRRDLLSGRWARQMPGEHQLSDDLKVSRSTLRLALDVLRREGLLQVSRGRRRRVRDGICERGSDRSKTVAVISSLPLHEHPGGSIVIVDELRRHLQQAGFDLQWHVIPQAIKSAGRRRLEELVEQTNAACWILSSSSLELQRWFEQYEGPILVQGSCHENVFLPFIRLDAAAACRHAVGLLHAQGHRRITLMLPRSPFAGTIEIEESLRKACDRLPGLGPSSHVRYHDADGPGVEKAIRAIMKAELRPTALIVMMPADTLSVYCHLLRNGFSLPRDISLLSIFDDLYLSRITPTVSRYTSDSYKLARRMAQQVIKIVGRAARPPSISIFPDFISGATIGPPPR